MEKRTILVVEDDRAIRNLIAATLELSHRYNFLSAHNGAAGLMQAISRRPDLIVLDLGLPDMDGVDIIRKIRSWTNRPIIVVSARSEDKDKIGALDAGADDYLTKPFSVEELLARIRVAIRKMNFGGPDPAESAFVNGGLKIDFASCTVSVDGKEIHLTPIEYKLLCILARNEGKVLTHRYLLSEVWGTDSDDGSSLRVFMATLRKKVEKDPANPVYIKTHIGIGYQLMEVPD